MHGFWNILHNINAERVGWQPRRMHLSREQYTSFPHILLVSVLRLSQKFIPEKKPGRKNERLLTRVLYFSGSAFSQANGVLLAEWPDIRLLVDSSTAAVCSCEARCVWVRRVWAIAFAKWVLAEQFSRKWTRRITDSTSSVLTSWCL